MWTCQMCRPLLFAPTVERLIIAPHGPKRDLHREPKRPDVRSFHRVYAHEPLTGGPKELVSQP